MNSSLEPTGRASRLLSSSPASPNTAPFLGFPEILSLSIVEGLIIYFACICLSFLLQDQALGTASFH